jgi:hypothetical protein
MGQGITMGCLLQKAMRVITTLPNPRRMRLVRRSENFCNSSDSPLRSMHGTKDRSLFKYLDIKKDIIYDVV